MKKGLVRGSLAAVTLGAALSAQAGVLGAFTVTAESSLGTATAVVSASHLTLELNDPTTWVDDTYSWSLDAPLELVSDSGAVVGVIDFALTQYIADPVVTLAFFAIAGGADTHFTITSGLLSFPTISNPIGQVSVGTTLTDSNANGATMTGMYGDGNMYRGYYNGGAAGGTVFSSQIGTFNAGASQTSVRSAVDGFRSVGTPVSDMQAQFNFTLSADDLSSGTARYEIIQNPVPEPASIAAVLIGSAALLRRRKK